VLGLKTVDEQEKGRFFSPLTDIETRQGHRPSRRSLIHQGHLQKYQAIFGAEEA